MPLSPGDKLGPYEILALIGKGGIGEVYRAHHSRIVMSRSQFPPPGFDPRGDSTLVDEIK